MIVCAVIYIAISILKLWKRNRRVFLAVFLANTLAFILFVLQSFGGDSLGMLTRNSYGEGERTEEYLVSVEGELENELIEIEVGEQEYTDAEVEQMFSHIKNDLDQIVLNKNQTFSHIENDLYFPDKLKDYPVRITWEVDDYTVLNADGTLVQRDNMKDGVEILIRGKITYKEKESVYTRQGMVYAKAKSEKESWLEIVAKEIEEIEKKTKENKSFQLPSEIEGKRVVWGKKKDVRGYYIILLGFCLGAVLVWKEKQDEKELQRKQKEQMLRDYPNIISQFTLLLSTGMTVKNVWFRIVETYDKQKENKGSRFVYEEMCITCREMQSGISEVEAYERFGKRCGISQYIKLGALLSQNIKKGSKGLADILKLEAIQAFENRKNIAKQKGEEVSTKLLLPMFGMLAVVMVIVIVPAFLSIQM